MMFTFSIKANYSYEACVKDYFYDRIKVSNKRKIMYSKKLNKNDLLNQNEIRDRVKWIIKYSKKFNYMLNDSKLSYLNWYDITLDITAIIEYETSFVNYASLDNGKSFGLISMRKDTAKWISDKRGDELKSINYLINNEEKQIEYAVWYYYYALRKRRSRDKALISYNYGLYAKLNFDRYENYFFNVKGRADYYREGI